MILLTIPEREINNGQESDKNKGENKMNKKSK